MAAANVFSVQPATQEQRLAALHPETGSTTAEYRNRALLNPVQLLRLADISYLDVAATAYAEWCQQMVSGQISLTPGVIVDAFRAEDLDFSQVLDTYVSNERFSETISKMVSTKTPFTDLVTTGAHQLRRQVKIMRDLGDNVYQVQLRDLDPVTGVVVNDWGISPTGGIYFDMTVKVIPTVNSKNETIGYVFEYGNGVQYIVGHTQHLDLALSHAKASGVYSDYVAAINSVDVKAKFSQAICRYTQLTFLIALEHIMSAAAPAAESNEKENESSDSDSTSDAQPSTSIKF